VAWESQGHQHVHLAWTRNMKNGVDGCKITHNEYFLFERKKGARA
jgi:hypothetical protein